MLYQGQRRGRSYSSGRRDQQCFPSSGATLICTRYSRVHQQLLGHAATDDASAACAAHGVAAHKAKGQLDDSHLWEGARERGVIKGCVALLMQQKSSSMTVTCACQVGTKGCMKEG